MPTKTAQTGYWLCVLIYI